MTGVIRVRCSMTGVRRGSGQVYFDNDAMELYHGRLDKTPGAIALRLRWYSRRRTLNRRTL